jgi:hypothetical protein
LDGLVAAGVAVEVTRRSKRRLFGLNGMAPLSEVVRLPYRPEPGRGRGRPPILVVEDDVADTPLPLPAAPLTPIDRRQFDYSDLDHWMAQMDQAIQHARRTVSALAQSTTRENASLSNEPLDMRLSTCSLDIPAGRDHQREPPAPVPG